MWKEFERFIDIKNSVLLFYNYTTVLIEDIVLINSIMKIHEECNCVICVLHSVPWHSFVKLYSFLPSILSHFSILTSSFLLLCCIKNQLLLHLSTHANFLIGTASSNPLHLLFSCSTLVPTSSSRMHSCFFSQFTSLSQSSLYFKPCYCITHT